MRIFNRDTEPTPRGVAGIPHEVATAIEAASVHLRRPGKDGESRVVVQLTGFAGWMSQGVEGDAKVLKKMFPDLSDPQSLRAARYLAALVSSRLRLRESDSENGSRDRIPWVHRW